jgi:hypothetical protein
MQNYKTIETRLEQCSDFTGNSLRGFWDGQTYKVFSYNTLIATNGYTEESGWQKWVDSTKYSNTTSRQQNLIKRAWNLV